ncbi:MAG: hypothetical protein QOI12_3628 [Alphaproteobacteria bacterium]|jgi:hypothetical protein|nr:hypothetical protein [Alphaproteobacteria bacterium]
MWVTLFAIAMAASVCLSMASLALQMNKSRDVLNMPVVGDHRGIEMRQSSMQSG